MPEADSGRAVNQATQIGQPQIVRRPVPGLSLVAGRLGRDPGGGRRPGLATLGISVAPSTVWEILQHNGLDPAPERNRQTWATFLHSQADALLPRRLPTHRSQGQNTVSQLRAVMPGQTRARRQGKYSRSSDTTRQWAISRANTSHGQPGVHRRSHP